MARKSHTHTGECQICGRRQAAATDTSRLAKHGYRVAKYGFFMGTCAGSDELPFELSKDAIEAVLVSVAAQIIGLNKRIAEVQALPADYGFYNEYIRAIRGFGGHYELREVVFSAPFTPYHPDTKDGYNKVTATTLEGRKLDADFYSANYLLCAAKSRESRIKGFENEIEQRKAYIAWQRKRMADWRVRELTPK